MMYYGNKKVYPVIKLQEKDKQVESLKNTANFSIDTGLIGNENLGFEIDFITHNSVSSTTGYGTIFGARTSSTTNEYALSSFGSGGSLTIGTTRTTGLGLVRNTRCTISYRDGIIKKNGADVATVTADAFTTPSNITLFAINGTQQYGTVTIYSLKFYDGATIVRDYVPMVDTNGIGYLLDRVENKEYYFKPFEISEVTN